MGHRHHPFNTAQGFQSERDRSSNYMPLEQPYAYTARTGNLDSSSPAYPAENMSLNGAQSASHWNSASRPNRYISAGYLFEAPHYQPTHSALSHGVLPHPSTARALYTPQEHYCHQAPSNYRGVDHKRKRPSIPSVYERGSSSRYHGSSSSSDVLLSSESQMGKAKIDPYNNSWDHNSANQTYRNTGISFRGECSPRNVRSRSANYQEPATYFSRNFNTHGYPTNQPIDHSGSVGVLGPSTRTSDALTREWRPVSSGPRNALVSDNPGFSHGRGNLHAGNSAVGASVEAGGYHTDLISYRGAAHEQGFCRDPAPSMMGACSNYFHRPMPTFGTSSSSFGFRHLPSSNERFQQVAENYYPGQVRPLSSAAWHSTNRSRSTRLPNERFWLPSDQARLEGFPVVDQSALYGSRYMFDQHRDMRLDIDNMTYEELLALGERIGNVSTGLSKDEVSKCLTETTYCPPDQVQEEVTCVICMEEYKKEDVITTLKNCSHCYHEICIKKWLSMKNSCPICKADAVNDDMKGK